MKSYVHKIAQIQAQMQAINKIDIEKDEYGYPIILNRELAIYDREKVPYLTEVVSLDDCSRKIVMGAFGSGKTSWAINEIIDLAVNMPPCDDGIRKSKWAIVRNTAGQLETTTLTTWNFWTEGLPKPHVKSKPQLTYNYKFRDKDGEIWLQILFLALDRVDDVRKLESLELTSVYINELRHIPKTIFNVLLSRIGRYPAKIEFIKRFERAHPELKEKDKSKALMDWTPYQAQFLADTNPPKNRHWISEIESKRENSTIKIYHQPPALLKDEHGNWYVNETADNIEIMGRQYYLDMLDRGEEFVKVYACGKYGTIVDGKPVYPGYNDDLHSIEDLPIDVNEPIYLGIDGGLVCPAILLSQVVGNQIRAIKEFIGDYISIKALCETSVVPFLNRYCPNHPLIATHDPANTAQCREQLEEVGIDSIPCVTNDVSSRITSVSNSLDRLIRGKPFYIISRLGCPILREGFQGEYCYRRLKVIGEEKYVDYPDKVHPHSDIHDGNQYNNIKMTQELGIKEEPTFNKQSYYEDEQRSVTTGY